MLKNSKLLKGITVALAFVLLIGGGILLGQVADAAGKTVVYYVSDHGDNTTGLDPATAFNTLADATKAANARKLDPGTEVLIYIVDKVTLTTQAIDANVVRDKNGDRLHLTVTSYDDESRGVIDMAYRIQGTATSGSQRAIIVNDATFRNIAISSRVHDVYVGDTASNGLWRLRNLYTEACNVEFDDCDLTCDQGKSVGTWYCYATGTTLVTTEGRNGLTFKNGDYSNVSVYTLTQAVPNRDVYFHAENASFNVVYVNVSTSTDQGDDAKSVELLLKDCTVKSFYNTTTGHLSVPGGITVTFDGTTVDAWTASNNTSTMPTVIADYTYNFIGGSVLKGATLAPRGKYSGNIVSNIDDCRFTSTYCAGGDAYTSVINGNITTNAKNCYFDFYIGGSRAAKIYGDVTNNLSDGVDCRGQYLGGNNDSSSGAHVLGTIYNNISGDAMFTNKYTGAGRRGSFTKVVNNISGDVVFKDIYYGGGGYYDGSTRRCMEGGHIVNNISGGHFGEMKAASGTEVSYERGVFLGNRLGSSKSITNNITGGTFSCETYFGNYNGNAVDANVIDATDIVNNVSGGTFKGYTTNDIKAAGFKPKLDSKGNETDFPRVFMLGNYLGPCTSLTNNITGGAFYNGDIYLGGGRQDTGLARNVISGDLVNNISGAADFKTSVFIGPRSQQVKGTVTNNIFGGSFNTILCGGYNIITDKIVNNFFDAEDGSHAVINGPAYMGSRGCAYNAAGYERPEIGTIINNVSGGVEFKKIFHGGGSSWNTATSVTYTVKEYNDRGLTYTITKTNTDANGTPTSYVVSRTDFFTIKDEVINNISGGVFNGPFSGGSDLGSMLKVTNNISGGTFNKRYMGVGGVTVKNGTAVNNISGGIFKGQQDSNTNYYSYGGFFGLSSTGSNAACAGWDVTNNVTGGTFENAYVGGSMQSFAGDVVNNVSGGHFQGLFKLSETLFTSFIGNAYYTGYADTVTNNISGGIFDANVFLTGRNGVNYTAEANAAKRTCVVVSNVSGGIFKGGRFSGSIYNNNAANSLKSVTLNIKPDDSANPLYFACTIGSAGSYGLDNFVARADVVTLYGATKPIQVAADTRLAFDTITGPVTILQTEQWKDGTAYVALAPEGTGIDYVSFASANSAVSGSAEIKYGASINYDGTTRTCDVLMGSSSAPAPTQSPSLRAVNFVMDSNLKVNFYADKAQVEAYIAEFGSFPYTVNFDGKALVSGSITDISTATIVGTFVKIECGFGIPAFRYGDTITVSLAGNATEYTVYELLSYGISGNDATLADLLKAIHNYGVKSETVKYGAASVSTYYDTVTYTGTYTHAPAAESMADGYNAYATGLAIDEDVLMNFYFYAEDLTDLTFTAQSASGALAADRITVTPFEGNSSYNVVVTLRLNVKAMAETYTVTASRGGTALATCTDSVTGACAGYIANSPEYADLAAALLAYVERA